LLKELHAHLNGSLSPSTLQDLVELKLKKDPSFPYQKISFPNELKKMEE
jgi:adenosine deaminase